MYTDSEAALGALVNPRSQAKQSSKPRLTKIDLLAATIQVSLHWIPGHQEIVVNEMVDQQAKLVATDASLSPKLSDRPLKSACQAATKKQTADKLKHIVMTDKHKAKHLRQILKHREAKAGAKYYKAAKTRAIATTLAQFRTGHCPLNAYLHRFNKAPRSQCECPDCQPETVQHYMLECRKYSLVERKPLREKVGLSKMRLGILLGNPDYIEHTAEYILMTKRMELAKI